ncbi:hypothetical protein [Acrocarpospora corrugata]|uniref:hypothetical protein n=1 Tax=Acrocarpospora corrugata TaxID=35763 RepID=UPI001FE5EBF6|nr:hypothetical protein [Acrocarpospora corrugata]
MVAARDQYAVLLPIRERVLGAEHPHTLNARGNLAYWAGGDGGGGRGARSVRDPAADQ